MVGKHEICEVAIFFSYRHSRATEHSKFTAVKTVWTRQVQAETRQNSGMNRGGMHECPTLAKELLAIATCWERESQYYRRIKSLVG